MRGYTLLEMLIVIAIIGILAALVILTILHLDDKAKQKATLSDIRIWGLALTAYYSENSRFPADPTELTPHYVKILPRTDRWGWPIVYHEDGISYTVLSFGKDGQPGICCSRGTRDFNCDISLTNGIFSCEP